MNTHTSLFMSLYRVILSTFLLLTSFTAAFATVEIISVSNATNGNCDGAITLMANGTAGPFVLLLEGTNGSVEYVTDVNSLYTFSNLCPADYTITVTNAIGCVTILNQEIKSCLAITSLTPICACPAPGYGSAVVETSGGSGEYDYLWELVGEQWIHIETGENPQFPHLSPIAEFPDTYELTVTDLATGCQATSSVEIGLCNGLNLASLIMVGILSRENQTLYPTMRI
jgi:hypothetical protein